MTTPADDLRTDLPWRVGKTVGRTIYAVANKAWWHEDDPLIGVMDTPELAYEAVEAHNERLTRG